MASGQIALPWAPYPHSPAAARGSGTSVEAAQDIAEKADTVREKVWDALRLRPMTVHETAAFLKMPVPTVQPRFSELKKQGRIEDSGHRRRNEVSGKKATVWRAVE